MILCIISPNCQYLFYYSSNRSKTEVEKKRKKKRKIILPKSFNPEVAPNPERWLPRHERTGYRKKKDRRSKETGIGKGTQGASNVSSEQL